MNISDLINSSFYIYTSNVLSLSFSFQIPRFVIHSHSLFFLDTFNIPIILFFLPLILTFICVSFLVSLIPQTPQNAHKLLIFALHFFPVIKKKKKVFLLYFSDWISFGDNWWMINKYIGCFWICSVSFC